MTINQTIGEIFDLYEKHGADDYIGEPVSQLEHMSQAAELAMREGFDDETILAAFFHDIGHLCAPAGSESMAGYGAKRHEQIGADYLRSKGFPEKVALLVENHVQAKRYLTFKFPAYYDSLSEASKKTLEFQGGKMTAAEATKFEGDSLFEPSIRMREWDDLAKETGVPIINLEEIKAKARSVLMQNPPR